MVELQSLLTVFGAVMGSLTALYGFHAKFIRPVTEFRTSTAHRLKALEEWKESHAAVDEGMVQQLKHIETLLSQLNTKVAVLDERSKHWGGNA